MSEATRTAERPDPSTLDATDRAHLPLIDRVVRGALDEEYAEVARRRAAAPAPDSAPDSADPASADPPASGHRRSPGVLGGVAVLAFATLVTVSFQQTRDNEDVLDASRTTLEQRIRTRREVVSTAQDQIVALRAQNSASEAALDIVDQRTEETDADLRGLRTDSGFSMRTGQGVRIEVDDSPDGLARHRVYDEDLALLTNGLWRAGAEAIAVNGQRLTTVSAFRFSGGTIRLNDVNLSPPYTVLALGDTRTLQADLLDTTTGLSFQSRADEFGFVVSMQNEDLLQLPAAPKRLTIALRSAQLQPDESAELPTRKENTP